MTADNEVDRLRKELRDMAMAGITQDFQMDILRSDVASLTKINKGLAASIEIYRTDLDRLTKAMHRIATAYDDMTGGPRFVAIAREALNFPQEQSDADETP